MKLYLISSLILLAPVFFVARYLNPPEVHSVNKSVAVSPECIGTKFSRFKVKKSDGSEFSNKDFSHKTVFVTFWLESSPTCLAELNEFNKMYEKLKDNDQFLFVSFCTDNDSTMMAIKEKYKIKYNFIHMDYWQCNQLNHNAGYPSSFILNKKGTIIYYRPRLTFDQEMGISEIPEVFYPTILKLLS